MCRVSGTRFRVLGSGFRVPDFVCRAPGFGFRVPDFELRGSGLTKLSGRDRAIAVGGVGPVLQPDEEVVLPAHPGFRTYRGTSLIRNRHPQDPTIGSCRGSYGSPWGGGGGFL